MFKRLSSYGLYGSTYACVEYSDFEGIPVFHGLKSKRKKGSFEEFESSSFRDFSALIQWLGKQSSVVAVINTAQVLIKEVDGFAEFSEEVVTKAFPSIRLDEFYYQGAKSKSGFYVAVCRKNVVSQIIKKLADQKTQVVGFSLGFSSLNHLKDQFSDSLIVPSASGNVVMSSDGIETYNSNPQESRKLLIASNEIQSAHVLALSGLSNYVAFGKNSNFHSFVESLKSDFRNRQLFTKGWKFAAAFLFVLLLINALAFNNLYKQKQELTEQAKVVESQKDIYAKRKTELDSKESLISSIVSNTGSKASFYLNRIVATVPTTIKLSEYTFQPIEGSIRPDKEIKITPEIIRITGTAINADDFGNWITSLEQLTFTENVQVDSFSDENQRSNFTLTLKLSKK